MIQMNNFEAEPLELREAMVNAVRRVFNSGWYVLGKECETFEKLWASTCGVEYAVGVGNGMDAIEIGLRSLNVGCGDEVITTPMTAFASVMAIIRSGATPVLADIDPQSALISLDSVERCITKKTKAILLVHLYGQIKNISVFQKLCASHQILLIEDCAQAHLTSFGGRIAGSFGVFGAYSFYPTKNLGAIGDAGILVTNQIKLAERAGRLRNYGQSVRYHHPEEGLNSRLDEIQAAILIERFRWLSKNTERRRQIAKQYRLNLDNQFVNNLSEPDEYESHSYHLFVVRCKNRNKLLWHLNSHGIQSLVHYPVPIHHQISCIDIKRDANGLRFSEEHSAECLSLPCHPQMSDSDVATVIAAVNCYK
jgi:dTDP-4-amino-4,6-dideoxygalactose transaminase